MEWRDGMRKQRREGGKGGGRARRGEQFQPSVGTLPRCTLLKSCDTTFETRP